ncbi:MAG: hypothetical protein LBG48_00510, partial [Rickettsiales bacterium]|nr:hypothetical protein [Rickettsiales bacterium]
GAYLGGRTRQISDPRLFTRDFASIRDNLDNMIKFLHRLGVTVWLVQGVPEYESYVPESLARAVIKGRSIESIALDYKRYENFYWPVDRIIYDIKTNNYFEVLTIEPPICNKIHCVAGDNDISYYADNQHLSAQGSIYFKNTFKKLIETIVQD